MKVKSLAVTFCMLVLTASLVSIMAFSPAALASRATMVRDIRATATNSESEPPEVLEVVPLMVKKPPMVVGCLDSDSDPPEMGLR